MLAKAKATNAHASLRRVVDVEDRDLIWHKFPAPDETTYAEKKAFGVGLCYYLVSAV